MAEVMLLYYHCRRSMRAIFIKNTGVSYHKYVLGVILLLLAGFSLAKEASDPVSALEQDAEKQQRLLIEKYGISQHPGWAIKCQSMIKQLNLMKFELCQVLAANHANAYSLANGVVLLTEGLLSNINNKHQLAHVLAHEHAHLALEHHQQAQTMVNNPPVFFTKSRLKKFYREMEHAADLAANELLIKHQMDHLQIHHYLQRIEQTTTERSAGHEKLKNRIQRVNLPPEQTEVWWTEAKRH